ncbi:hypothetical protein AVEN_245580-1 [Araneus ventricosus]|uniref:Transposase IS30-like HTH domain-containing protein n=1 Tax=Araneus ventricosus TaxID=182803 RepID=A0A4Y2H4E0_ARAVE|nr:hypothetical protein AVEN_245580-1 [Araneus ventricosus]
MPKALQLSNEEVNKILHLKLLCKTVKEILKLLNRSKSMIYRVLTRKTPYEPKPCSGRPRVADIRRDRQLQRMAFKSENYKIFLHKLFDCIGKKPSQTDASTAPLSRPLLEHFGQTNSSGNYTTNSSQEGSSESSASSGQTAVHSRHSAPVPLYVPGRILHLSRADSGFSGRWVSSDYFNQIIISPTMISDHMVYNVHNALRQLVTSSGNFP